MSRDEDGRRRVIIEGVHPEIDCGRFPAKRTVGESVTVEADVFADGHDAVACVLLWRPVEEEQWREVTMEALVNDRWRGSFVAHRLGRFHYTLEAWVDAFGTWRRAFERRLAAEQQLDMPLKEGSDLLRQAAGRATGEDAERLQSHARLLGGRRKLSSRVEAALDPEVAGLAAKYPDRSLASRYGKELALVVEREKAGFSTWYELFPRSTSPKPGRHGTFRDVEARLPYVAGMGFDVLYLPPIHPIGKTHRKGRNNAPRAEPGDPGSPWGIGGKEGGHTAVHPELGTLDDFRRLVGKAAEHGLEIALDLAYQCSADHPWIAEHPEWFKKMPDGSIQYAENPPKKYEDIYPLDFDCDDWRQLWGELKSVVSFWIEQGVRIFRVDNPHTKPFTFWEWLIEGIRREHPEVVFLSEAFTRPKVMYRLAKLGFSQSYNYFPWRNTKWELTDYYTELTQSQVAEFFRASNWPNTPDILTEWLQFGGRPAFVQRLVLAATLAANYGIYGPAFELCESRPRQPGSEEYLNSEKYEIRHWDLERSDGLRELIARVNRIRRENAALQRDRNLRFHRVDNEQLLCYSKVSDDRANVILVVVNLDVHYTQAGWVDLDLWQLGLEGDQPYQVHDLLSGAHYLWEGPRNYVELDPHRIAAHIFRLRRRVRSERDFDYFM